MPTPQGPPAPGSHSTSPGAGSESGLGPGGPATVPVAHGGVTGFSRGLPRQAGPGPQLWDGLRVALGLHRLHPPPRPLQLSPSLPVAPPATPVGLCRSRKWALMTHPGPGTSSSLSGASPSRGAFWWTPCPAHPAESLAGLRTPARGSGSGDLAQPSAPREAHPASERPGPRGPVSAREAACSSEAANDSPGRARTRPGGPGRGRSSAERHELGGTGGLAGLPLGSQCFCRPAPSADDGDTALTLGSRTPEPKMDETLQRAGLRLKQRAQGPLPDRPPDPGPPPSRSLAHTQGLSGG